MAAAEKTDSEKTAEDVKNIFNEYNPQLVQYLPLKDYHFIAKLTQQNLFSGTLKEDVMESPKPAEAASLFLFRAVERPLGVAVREPFDKLLLVMENFGDPTLNKLAKEIKQKLSAIHHRDSPDQNQMSTPEQSPASLQSADNESSYMNVMKFPSVSADVPPPLPPRTRTAKNTKKSPEQEPTDQLKGAKVSQPTKTDESPIQKLTNQFEEAKVSKPKKESSEFGHFLQSGKYILKWTKHSKLPTAMWGPYATVINSTLYISGGWCPNDIAKIYDVYKYDLDKNQWSVLPPLQQFYGIPVNISNQLTIIGGRCSTPPYKPTDLVTTYDDSSWNNTYPNLSLARLAPAVVPYHQYVIVAGGKDDHGSVLDSIEVFDITEPHWMIVNTHLPQPMYQISATICGDSFTIVGYDDANKKRSSEAYTIPVEGILAHSPSSTDKDNTKWHQLADAPYWKTALVPNTSPPIIIGGDVEQDIYTVNDITIYDDTSNKWNKISSLPINCALTTVAVIDQSIIVMGGCTDTKTNATRNTTVLSDVNIGQLVD